ncbi:hypothetical protein GGR58DRAFT_482931 [Xylaria digitata]|nr:hypothetical protein GGR58DRAFT_482931 [Xylaria digitata]
MIKSFYLLPTKRGHPQFDIIASHPTNQSPTYTSVTKSHQSINMKWQLSLLSLASLPAVFAAPVENPAHSAVEVKAREATAAVESPEKRNDDEVELLWGTGRWQYGGSKREEPQEVKV